MRYTCPVCGYPRLPYPPRDYHICPCCSTEFGNDDAEFSHIQLREMWIAGDARWFFGNPPPYWNPWLQLIDAGYTNIVPSWKTQTTPSAIVAKTGSRLDFSREPWQVSPAA